MAKPNFLIIGDLKAGTTSLHYYLSQHPDIYMPSQKELRYFAYDGENPYHVRSASYRVKDYDEYLSCFDEGGDAKAIGEASPNYLRSRVAAQRIKDKLPDSRLIISLRNPADRLHSLYMMLCREGAAVKPFDEQLFDSNAAWIKSYFCWHDLQRYFDLFERDRIKIVIFDDLKEKTLDIVKDLYAFLGVDNAFTPDIEVRNRGGMPRNRHLFSILTRVEKRVKNMVEAPAPLRKIWAHIKAKSLENVGVDPLIRRKIIEECADDIDRTQELIKRDLSIWMKPPPKTRAAAANRDMPG